MEQGTVFNIQKFCINDGPGIRTTVFLKGCPLRCAWCHNPESQVSKPEIFYNIEKCIGCMWCQKACKKDAHFLCQDGHIYDREKCEVCGACVDACPSKALELAGEVMTVDAVIAEVLKDKAFYGETGGMTLSGGEPMMQYAFALALLKRAKEEGLHTCIETCGYAQREHILTVAQFVDIFLFDWKISDSALHKQYTGVENTIILENLLALDQAGKQSVLRCPIIPTVNDNEEHFKGIAKVANDLQHILGIEVEPYHPLGTDKLVRLAKEDTIQKFPSPKDDAVDQWIEEIQSHTSVPVKKA